MYSCEGCFFASPIIDYDLETKSNTMKNKIYAGLMLVALAIFTACDNKNTDVGVIDGPPTIEIGTITGAVEGDVLNIPVSFTDGTAGTAVSTLDRAEWSIVSNGAVGSGTETLSGNSASITIVYPGLTAGDYTFIVNAFDSNGNSSTAESPFTVASGEPDFDISGEWTLEPVQGALKVGPSAGSSEWWQNSAGDVEIRACLFDDTYTFDGNGGFAINMGDQTWLEPWQGMDPEACGAPVAPFVSSDAFSYVYTETTLTLVGQGAALGLSKVNNQGEISNGAPVADQVAYTITAQSEDAGVRRMTLQIEAGSGVWWEFLLISGDGGAGGTPSPIEGTWTLSPIEGALAVGPSAGSSEWWQNSADDVNARACQFDDTWTFDASGNMMIDVQTETWVEGWQGGGDACGAPVAPFESGTFAYTYAGGELTVNGAGAYVGLPKATNNGEISDVADAATSITYQVTEITDTEMTLQINYNPGGDGWWQFKLTKQ